jgi:hypothetical protein
MAALPSFSKSASSALKFLLLALVYTGARRLAPLYTVCVGRISLADPARSQGPTSQALRSGRPVVARQFATFD